MASTRPRRGPTFNNRWWNDRRSWNLRTTNSREKASPKGANHIQSCSCSPPSGTTREYLSLSAGSIPFGHSTRGYSHSPPSGTVECYLRNLNTLSVGSRPLISISAMDISTLVGNHQLEVAFLQSPFAIPTYEGQIVCL